ncbi:MAG: sensor domain-containing diguanylate cyclase [Nitriliruptoraceae bacterium]|nr:sensor domain-containing diguanylate cyclase [Nitriliruptoraceae bacterium]
MAHDGQTGSDAAGDGGSEGLDDSAQHARLASLEAELAAARRTEHVLVEHAPIGMLLIEPDGLIHHANPALCELLGVAASDLVGRRLSSLLQAQDRDHLDSLWEAFTAQTLQRSVLERRLRVPRGRSVWAQLCAVALPAGPGGIARLLVQVVDLTARRALEEELRTVALQDPLTGLANRRALEDRFAHARARQQRYGGDVGLLFIDLDRFKTVNDDHGHDTGDRMLREVARTLTSAVRATDTVCRFGGDEFVVLLAELDTPERLHEVADRIAGSSAPVVRVRGHELSVGLSVGATLAQAGDDLESCLRRADIAMYRDKQDLRRARGPRMAEASHRAQAATLRDAHDPNGPRSRDAQRTEEAS